MTAVMTVPGSTTPDDSGRLADLRAAEQLGELADARLLLALLVFRGVVAAVLLEVALFTRGLDALGDLLATARRELLELGGESIEGLLGEPGDGGVLRHGALLRIDVDDPDVCRSANAPY